MVAPASKDSFLCSTTIAIATTESFPLLIFSLLVDLSHPLSHPEILHVSPLQLVGLLTDRTRGPGFGLWRR